MHIALESHTLNFGSCIKTESIDIIRSTLGGFSPSARFICLLNCKHTDITR